MSKQFSFNDFNVTKHEAKLSNGVRVVLFERPNTPISMKVLFFSGSRFDPIGKEGLAHFAEHMVVAGTKKFPTKDTIAIFIEGLGGGFGAYTGGDVLGINFFITESTDFPNVVTLLNEILNNALFDPKTIENERGSIFHEIAEEESNPQQYLRELNRVLFYQNTKAGRSTLGSEDTVNSISRSDLMKYYTKMLSSGRVVIVLSGDISIVEVIDTMESGLEMKKSRRFRITKDLPVVRDFSTKIGRYEINDQIHFEWGFRVCSEGSNDEIPLILLANILGGGRAGSLEKKLRYENGLVYSVWARCYCDVDSGTFTISTSTPKKHLQQVMDIIVGEFERVLDKGITKEELAFVKNKKLKSQKARMETSRSWANFHAYKELVLPSEYLSLPEYLSAVAKVSLNDIHRVGKNYLEKDSWYLAMCGDIEEKDVVIRY